jgi:hypothetical protein
LLFVIDGGTFGASSFRETREAHPQITINHQQLTINNFFVIPRLITAPPHQEKAGMIVCNRAAAPG